MAATQTTDSTVTSAPVLYLALDLGTRDGKLAFTEPSTGLDPA